MGCQQEVEIYADSEQVWGSNLGADRLDLTPELSAYVHPSRALSARIDSPERDIEVVFLPFDPAPSYGRFQENLWQLSPGPSGAGVGYFHPLGSGDVSTYYFGEDLLTWNEGQPQALLALYQRKHGSCELEIPWELVLGAVLDRVQNKQISSCPSFVPKALCDLYDWTEAKTNLEYSERTAGSHLRQQGVQGRGGFGLHVEGKVRFTDIIGKTFPYFNWSYLFPDVTFAGTGAYDLQLGEDGVPMVAVSGAPSARTECPPALYCTRDEVRTGIVEELTKTVVKELNPVLQECLAVPVPTATPCGQPSDCAASNEARILALGAALEVEDRGGDDDAASAFQSVLTDSNNWRCAPITDTCASAFGGTATEAPVCQLQLQAVDLVPMPG
ncbi:MAG: hypothetical protein IT376_20810, partial [Polyangiaceae bacterium]|nr:hypothetical protein [Polyangiaceae bacterium]